MTTFKQQKFGNIGSMYLVSLYLFSQSYTWGRVSDTLIGTAIGAISSTCGTAWSGGPPDGQQTGSSDPVKRASEFQVFHDIGDGTVSDYLDVTKLTAGVDHKIWDSKGNVFRGSKHESGNPMLSVDLPLPTKLRGRSTGQIQSFTIIYDSAGDYAGDYTQKNANADAENLSTTYSNGQGSYLCASNSDGGASSIIFSFTPTSSEGLYPRGGFDACSP